MIRRVPKFRLLLGFGAVFAVAFVAACGAEEGVTKEELRSVVQEAVAGAIPAAPAAAPSAEEIRALVSEAVTAAAPPGVSSAEIKSLVEAAVGAATTEAVTAEQIEQLVSKAVGEAVSEGPTPLSSSQVEAIVAAAVAAIPTPAPVVVVATPAPPRPPTGRSVALTIAQPVLHPMIGDPAVAPYRDWEQSLRVGITESLFTFKNGDAMSPHLATGWRLSPDSSKATITIRKGIPWNTGSGAAGIDFGELDAQDVVWFLNRNNSTTNPQTTSGDAGDLAAVFGEARVVDTYTLELDMVPPAPTYGLPLSDFGVLGATVSIRSKKVFDKMGPTWVVGNAVGTGPFVQKEWISNERGTVEALGKHWVDSPDPDIKTVTWIQVPELSSRVAMLESGAVDAAVMDFKIVPGLIKRDSMPTSPRVRTTS